MKRDPVCGKTVAVTSTSRTRYLHHDYYFCSEPCAVLFSRDPERFADRRHSLEKHEPSAAISAADAA